MLLFTKFIWVLILSRFTKVDCNSSLVSPDSDVPPKAITWLDDVRKNENEKTITRKKNVRKLMWLLFLLSRIFIECYIVRLP